MSLDNGLLLFTTISYFAAKPFAMIPNLFRNYLSRRVQSEENKLRNSEFPSNSSSEFPRSSTEMNIISNQGSAFSGSLSSDSDANTNDNKFKLFEEKPDFGNKYNGENDQKSKVIHWEILLQKVNQI